MNVVAGLLVTMLTSEYSPEFEPACHLPDSGNGVAVAASAAMLVEVVACAAVAGKDPTGHTFVTGGGFFGLQPMSISGSLHE